MIRRQVFDIPKIEVRVVEHRLIFRRCGGCGTLTAAAGSAGVTASVQYGPYAAAIAVYLVLGQHLPVERTTCLLAEVLGMPTATSTVADWTVRAAAGLAPFTAAAPRALGEAELVHLDETGLRVAGRLLWLRVATSTRFTTLFCNRKRGKEAIDAAGVLPEVTGIVVHDAFAPYAHYPAATHALCDAPAARADRSGRPRHRPPSCSHGHAGGVVLGGPDHRRPAGAEGDYRHRAAARLRRGSTSAPSRNTGR